MKNARADARALSYSKKTVRAFFVAAYRSGNRAGDSRKATLWHTCGTV